MSEEYRAPEAKIVETEEVELNQPLLISGFVGAGLVGPIAVNHILEQLEMKEIAHVKSRYLPPAAVFTEGKLRHPFRIYANSDGSVCAMICEVPLRSDGLYPIAHTLLDWAEGKGMKEVIVLEGAPVKGIPKERSSYCAAEANKCKKLQEKGIEILTKGLIGGIAGSILSECMTRKIVGITILTPAVAFIPDPEGGATLLEALNKAYDLEIDTSELLSKAKDIKKRLKEVAQQYRRARRSERKREVPEGIYY